MTVTPQPGPAAGAVFIPHARADLERVDELVQAIEIAGLDVWTDRRTIAPGTVWRDELDAPSTRALP